jgi:hypothetical protein
MSRSILTAVCIVIVTGTAACASTSGHFNPDHLGDVRLARVEGICQTVMGLSPTERLTSGDWRGDDNKLSYSTSHYRGCVKSLSDSLLGKLDARAIRSADAQCRGEGDANGSPALALCDLNSTKHLAATQGAGSVPTSAAVLLPAAATSFFLASPEETRQRERTACAALGIDPSGDAFGSCVENLGRTFFAIDNPIT